jgi:hypothetical protein
MGRLDNGRIGDCEMKYVLILLVLSSCSYSKIDTKELEFLKEQQRKTQLQMNTFHCDIGVFIVINKLQRLLYKKVTKTELDEIWKECAKLGVDNE